MSNYNLEWFKSNKELEELQIENEKLKNKILKKQLGEVESPSYTVSLKTPVKKIYKNIKLVNDVLTIILHNGNILTKSNATSDDFMNASNSKSIEDLLKIVTDPEILAEKQKIKEEADKIKSIKSGIDKLNQLDDFVIDGDSVYLKNINRSLPQLLVEHFSIIANQYTDQFGKISSTIHDDYRYVALKRFFMWCCLNPRAEVAHELYRFLVENSFKITKQGFFLALRNVVTVEGGAELVHFVSNAYNKVKAVWKKSPDKYHVILKDDGKYELIHKDDMFKESSETCSECLGEGVINYDLYDEACYICDGKGVDYFDEQTFEGKDMGTLTELYLDLPNRAENRFTDDWTRTFDIRIGKPVNMPMEECNWSTQDCAASGLHFTADQINYVGCGDQSVLVLINPMKVVGIGEHKGRCYEYLPIMTVPREESTKILHDNDFDALELDDAYAIRELENLADKVKEGFATEAKKYSFSIPSITSVEVDNITKSLDEMMSELSKRIKIVE